MTRYVRDPRVLWRRSGDSVVLLPLDSADVCVLGATGLALWEVLAEPTAVTDVARQLGNLYDVLPEGVMADVEPVLVDLERRQLVRSST